MNTYGKNFRITVFGESHGPYTGIVIDGATPGISIALEDFNEALHRRKFGDIQMLQNATTPRKEDDTPIFAAGILEGKTTGAPLAILFENRNCSSEDYANFKNHPRPSHADFSASVKYKGLNDLRGGGSFSGRMTLPLVAAGVVARKMLQAKGYSIKACGTIASIGGEYDSAKWKDLVRSTKEDGDSVGGEIKCSVEGVPAGVGEPFFYSLESQIAHLAFSVPGVKGIQFGDFADITKTIPGKELSLKVSHVKSSSLKGTVFNDTITGSDGRTSTNHSGGINGGISNGNPIVFTLDIRPTASIAKPQHTFNFESGKIEELSIGGRHDVCIALRCPVIAEAISYICLADNLL